MFIIKLDLKHGIAQKNIYRDGLRTPTSSQTLPPVTLVKRQKPLEKSPGEPNSDVAGFDNRPLIT